MGTTGVVFPGQGAQKIGMGKDFFDAYPIAQEIFAAASQAIDVDMQALCFVDNETINQTEFTQPAILTAEIAMLGAILANTQFEPKFFGGHSLGEYTALVAGGVIPFEAAVKIVRKRGALMQNAVPVGVGAMAALIAPNIKSTGALEEVTSAGAEAANFNSTDQVVISGRKEAVESAVAAIAQKFPDIRAVMLNVSAPFHCTLMREIEGEFEDYLRSFEGSFDFEGSRRVVSNYFGGFHTPERLIEGLVKQISGSVNWLANMETLKGATDEIFEIGPARVLSRFFSSVDVSVKTVTDVKSFTKNFPKE